MYRDSNTAPLLDTRRRFKAVLDVLDSMISHGVTLSRSIDLAAQWGKILSVGPLYPVVFHDLHAVEFFFGLGDFRRVVGDVHRRFSDFIHGVVVHRRDEALREWRNWLREDPLVDPYKWLRPDLVPPVPFLQCQPHRTPSGSGFFQIRPGLMKNSERLGFPTSAVLGKGMPALRNSMRK